MAKNYYQYGKEIGLVSTPDDGAFVAGVVTATIANQGSPYCKVKEGYTFTGTRATAYNIHINTTGSAPNTINWNDSVLNPSKSIIRSVVSSNVVTAYVKNHEYLVGDNIRTYGSGAFLEKNITVSSVVDENSFTYAHTAGDSSSTGGSVWRWNENNISITGDNALNKGISIVMLITDVYGIDDSFAFTVSNTTGKTVRVHYYKEPAVLALNSDTPEIKSEHHEALVMYACKQLSRRLDFKRYPIYSNEWSEWHDKVISSGKYIREESLQSTYRNY